jgi:hypothetical protein
MAAIFGTLICLAYHPIFFLYFLCECVLFYATDGGLNIGLIETGHFCVYIAVGHGRCNRGLQGQLVCIALEQQRITTRERHAMGSTLAVAGLFLFFVFPLRPPSHVTSSCFLCTLTQNHF